jgi:hypothetical protein
VVRNYLLVKPTPTPPRRGFYVLNSSRSASRNFVAPLLNPPFSPSPLLLFTFTFCLLTFVFCLTSLAGFAGSVHWFSCI